MSVRRIAESKLWLVKLRLKSGRVLDVTQDAITKDSAEQNAIRYMRALGYCDDEQDRYWLRQQANFHKHLPVVLSTVELGRKEHARISP